MKLFKPKLLLVSPGEINEYIQKETQGISQPRDFVKIVKEYLSLNADKGLIITGLRSTGKTSGVLQGIAGSNLKAIYVSPLDRVNKVSDRQIIRRLEKKNFDIVVIDEYTWIESKDSSLANYLAGLLKSGKKVIITGTDSAKIHALKNTEFIHRTIEINTTYFAYDEYCRIYGLEKNTDSRTSYLKNGGIFESHASESFGSMRDYIQNAIIDNLASYYPNYDPEVVKVAIYTLFYECIHKTYLKEPNETAPIYNYESNDLFETYLNMFGVNTSIKVPASITNEIASKLQEIGVLVKLNDLRLPRKSRMYITNQSISYQMVKVIYNLDELSHSYLGHLYEASVVCNQYMQRVFGIINPSYQISYLEGRKKGQDYEIDFVLYDKKSAYLFDCKYSSNSDITVSETASIAKDIVGELLGERDICGRFIVYEGKNQVRQINGKTVVFVNDWNFNPEKFDEIVNKENKNKNETMLPLANNDEQNSVQAQQKNTNNNVSDNIQNGMQGPS